MKLFAKNFPRCLRWAGRASAGALALAGAFAGAARADEHSASRVAPLPRYAEECGSCHTAYPPGLLPVASWQRLMDNLPRHFGSDASLEPAVRAELSKWLEANAASFRRVKRDTTAPPEDRITRSAWFVREHHDVSAAVWKRKAVGSASNCVACHADSAMGRFSDHDVRIPK